MRYLAMDRHFVLWNEEKGTAAARLSEYALTIDEIDWAALRKFKRVVLLAEAGSGKTAELKEQACTVTAAGALGFYCTVKDTAQVGLAAALGPDRMRFESWMSSEGPAWFFVDAVDEAKLDRIELRTALVQLSEFLGARLRDAHIVLAGRITDWEPQVDRDHFAKILPVPPPPQLPDAPSLLTQALNGEARRRSGKRSADMEPVRIVLMTPLDETRVRSFAVEGGIEDANRFIRAIEERDLWFLAQRPRDLDWLVGYWNRAGRFGSLAQMIDASLRARLIEANPQHALEDTLDSERAFQALERVGAALVFAKIDKIAVEDSGLSLTDPSGALHLAEVLPEWSAADRRRLLTRAVFDPATFATVRLHNDNEGTVRAYLAASWLRRRFDQHAGNRALNALLFRDLYGYALVRPSARQTAAWLSVWNDAVVSQVRHREPDLLLQYGDPGSLPIAVRAANLVAAVKAMAGANSSDRFFSDDSLQRLATPALGSVVRAIWKTHATERGCRHLLLRIIRLGRMNDCAGLAEAALSRYASDEITAILAGRALVACADRPAVEAYAERLRHGAASLAPHVIWEAIDSLFPAYLSVEDFLRLIERIDSSALLEYPGLDYFGPRAAERLRSRTELEQLFSGVVSRLGTSDEEEGADERLSNPLKLLGKLATELMKYVPPTEVPALVIDAVLRIRTAHRHRGHDEISKSLVERLSLTPEARRIVFWHVVRAWAHDKRLGTRTLQSVWDLNVLGWPSVLREEDLGWLLADARAYAVTSSETRLALDAAVDISERYEQRPEVLEQIRREAAGLPELDEVMTARFRPRTRSPIELEHEHRMAEHQAKREREEREREVSWTAFIAQLQADPNQLRKLPPQSGETVDSRLYHLWQLLTSLDGRDSRYALDDLRPLEPVLGPEVTAAFGDALPRFWRQWHPTLESTRPMGQRNLISNFDCIGICAVSVEARQDPKWSRTLSAEEAVRAAQFGTLELNGFPFWMASLAVDWPQEVSEVVVREVVAEVADTSSTPHMGPLQDLESGPTEVCRAVATRLLELLRGSTPLTERQLSQILTIVNRGLAPEAADFLALILERAAGARDPNLAACYLAAAFYRDPAVALKALKSRLVGRKRPERCALVESLLPRLLGDLFRGRDHEPPLMQLPVLEALVIIAFDAVRLSDDLNRPSGQVFSPDRRDSAERSRDGLLRRLSLIPGAATVAALRRLSRRTKGILPVHFERMCRERAAEDADSDAWTPRAPYEFEQDTVATEQPRTSGALQSLARNRLEELAAELRDGDFSAWTQLKSCAKENGVQRFLARELSNRRGGAYTLEREPHVADEKEPDVRLQACVGDARLPIEIKDTASGWSLKELEYGLTNQLVGRYMREDRDRHGIYLIVHRFPRIWRPSQGGTLDFPALIRRLQSKADRLASKGDTAPQVQVMSINISDLGSPVRPMPRNKKRRAKKVPGRRARGSSTSRRYRKP